MVADMRMPGMTGLELFEALVAPDRAIPTVLITAYPDEQTRLRARQAGILCYLSKPLFAGRAVRVPRCGSRALR